MSNVINYMMQDLYINANALDFAKYMEMSDDYRISYSKFCEYADEYIKSLNYNIINPLSNEITIENLKKYFYLCITLNNNLSKDDVKSLVLDLDFFNYNLIVLNTMLYIK